MAKPKKKVSCRVCKFYGGNDPSVKFNHACGKKKKKLVDCTKKNAKANCKDFKEKK